VTELWLTLEQLVMVLLRLAGDLLVLGGQWSLLIAWIAWWLWGVNWKKAWPVLRAGAWAPVVLLVLISALAWSRIAPSSSDILYFFPIGNFWWQLGAVSLLAGLAFFCGWLQGLMGYEPGEIDLEPKAAHGAAHHHEHA